MGNLPFRRFRLGKRGRLRVRGLLLGKKRGGLRKTRFSSVSICAKLKDEGCQFLPEYFVPVLPT